MPTKGNEKTARILTNYSRKMSQKEIIHCNKYLSVQKEMYN